MNNPWNEIALSDYESHMSLSSVYQLQAMNEMMKEQFCACEAKTVMILGIAGGNGLEHVHPNSFDAVYGVDINPKYLTACEKRYPQLSDIFCPLCTDLMSDDCRLPHADLLIANLLIEYIGCPCFQNVVKLVQPNHVSCIIQINTDESFVSDSPYLHAFDRLYEVHHQMEEAALIEAMHEIDYRQASSEERALPNGKKLVRIDFAR